MIERHTALCNIDLGVIRGYFILPEPLFTRCNFSILRGLSRILGLEVTNLYTIFFASESLAMYDTGIFVFKQDPMLND